MPPKTAVYKCDLPKDKVLSKIRNYLQLLGRGIDQIVLEYEGGPHKKERMRTRLWNYVSTFSNLSGEKLHQIYSKLKQEQQLAAGVEASQINGSISGDQASALMDRGIDTENLGPGKGGEELKLMPAKLSLFSHDIKDL